MIYLIGSVLLSAYLALAFKAIGQFRISNFQTIVINYIVCVATGIIVNGTFPVNTSIMREPWLPWTGLMGISFIFLFNIMAFTAQKIGVAVTSVAFKLSLVIPFIFSLLLYNEPAGVLKIAGIFIALIAVILTSWPGQKSGYAAVSERKSSVLFLLPVILFFGSGLLDTMIKYVEQRYVNESNHDTIIIVAFGIAAFIGIVFLLMRLITGTEKFDRRSIIAGILIGVPNYFSIWCLVKVLKTYGDNSSAIIPINNMAVVMVSAVAAWMIFREQLSVRNWFGILLAIGAIALIAYA